MISSVSIQNFKCYQEKATFQLGKINLFTGINGKGKSSFLQSLLLFRQSIEHNISTTRLFLNGSSVRLGTFSDVKNADTSSSKEMNFEFGIKQDDIEILACYSFISDDKNDRVLLLKNLELTSPNGNHIFSDSDSNFNSYACSLDIEKEEYINSKYWDKEIFDSLLPKSIYIGNLYIENAIELSKILDYQKIHYIGADRLGPQEFYAKNNMNDFIHVGKQGELVADVLSYAQKEQLVVNSDISRSIDRDILSQAGEWLGFILDCPKLSIKLDDNDKYRSSILFNLSRNENSYTPQNVGFGYSYTLPIIVAGLIAQKGEILIVENPEAHLHPRAQSRLSQFLAKIASMGVQVFVESHSEHILNGIRIASISSDIDLSNEDVSVFFFHDNMDELFTKLPIEKDGSIKNWVDGFFDQQEIDLSELFKINRAKK